MKKREPEPEMKTWSVPCRVVLQGYATVEAETEDDARAQVDSGAFDIDPGAELVDWAATGKPKLES